MFQVSQTINTTESASTVKIPIKELENQPHLLTKLSGWYVSFVLYFRIEGNMFWFNWQIIIFLIIIMLTLFLYSFKRERAVSRKVYSRMFLHESRFLTFAVMYSFYFEKSSSRIHVLIIILEYRFFKSFSLPFYVMY